MKVKEWEQHGNTIEAMIDAIDGFDSTILSGCPLKIICDDVEYKFVTTREEILSMIWDMEEEIMGKEN